MCHLYNDRPIPGPYIQQARERWLSKVLDAQRHLRENGPSEVRDIELITFKELQEIRRIWVVEKHEIEDRLPRLSEGAGMAERQASLEPPVEVLRWAGGAPMFCAIAGRQPWIDRISDRFFERSFQEALRRSVEAFRARERLGARAFGSAAAGDPDFIEGLLCGGGARLRLDAADTVLGFMGEAPLGPLFACEVDAYLSITGTPAQRLGLGAVGEASFVRRLRAGHAPRLGTADRARRWMGMHSSPAQRRAIAAATLYPEWWRSDAGEGRQRGASLQGGHGLNRTGAPPRYLNTVQAAEMVGRKRCDYATWISA